MARIWPGGQARVCSLLRLPAPVDAGVTLGRRCGPPPAAPSLRRADGAYISDPKVNFSYFEKL
eukprot:COSAG05_NODE_849_length_6979_cov_23.287936_3_plen_63_part_00